MVKKNILSILVAIIILYLSLASSDTFNKVPIFNIRFLDKIVHFCMYFGFMSVIIFENRKTIRNNKHLILIANIPLFYGILMEILQTALTNSRSGSIYDAISDLAGILVSVLIWLWIRPFTMKAIR
jgi:VanZ family protein